MAIVTVGVSAVAVMALAAAAQLTADGANALAGGQTLLASMKLRLSNPDQLVDLSGIKELTSIKREGNAFVIGAMTRHADVAIHISLLWIAGFFVLVSSIAYWMLHTGYRMRK